MKPQVKLDDQGRPYILVVKEIHGQETEVKVYGDYTKRPKQTVR